MALVSSKKMLADAQAGGYAIGAFNADNMEMMMGIVRAAEAAKAPVMLQINPALFKVGNLETFTAIALAEAKKADAPVCVHLDHGSGFEVDLKALKLGFTSVMIDGSKFEFDENVAFTKRVADAAAALSIPCEGELGRIGGKEDGVVSDGPAYTDPDEAVEFVKRTGVTSLAIGIGTAHGFYKGTPVLNKERLCEIRSKVDVPLVLHGASGVGFEDLEECISKGICKINFATDLRVAYTKAVREVLADTSVYDPKVYGMRGIESVKETAIERMKTCGCVGKA